MTDVAISRWRLARRLGSALALLGALAAAPAHAASWRLEPIASSGGVVAVRSFDFDAQGRGLLSWEARPGGRGLPLLGGLATRDPAGGWTRPPNLAGIEASGAQIHMHSLTGTLLVGREPPSRLGRRRLVVADGRSDGGFGPFAPLADYVVSHWSAASAAGDAIVAWTSERSPFVRVAERARTGRFGPARDLAVGASATVAMNARGDRVLAWRAGRRLAARVRLASGKWSRTARFGRVERIAGLRLSALVGPTGRVVLTWGSVGSACGVSVRNTKGRWRTRTLERRCSVSGVDTEQSPVLPIADGRGATYVVWTGRLRSGRRAVKLARVGAGASRRPLVLSRQRGAVLDDVAAGPRRSLAITYAAPRPTKANRYLVATYAALRRGGGSFGRASRVTPREVAATRGSRVAFQPLTGEPVVVLPYLVGLDVAIGAAVGRAP